MPFSPLFWRPDVAEVLHGLIQHAVIQVQRQASHHVRIDGEGRVWRRRGEQWIWTPQILKEVDDRVAFLMGELPTPEDHV